MAAGMLEKDGWTSLHEAAAHPEELRQLEEVLKTGTVEVNQKSWCGETPLHVACQCEPMNGVKEAVSLLLQNGANVNMRDKQGRTPLLCAAMTENLDVVATLLSSGHADPDLADIFGQSPMHVAAFHVRFDIVECLLQAGASVPVQNIRGVSPVYVAAKLGHSRCLEKLLQVAVQNGRKEVVDLYSRDGLTPLISAVKFGHVECVQILLKYGANPNLKANSLTATFGCSTALHFAISDDHNECIRLLLDKTDLQQLVYRADTISVDPLCPLYAAIRKKNYDLLRRLLSLGFPVDNVHAKDHRGVVHGYVHPFVNNEPFAHYQTSLSYAAAVKDIDSMKILLEYGASVNPVLYDTVNGNGVQQKPSFPPVVSALSYRSWDAFNLLIEHGCDVSCQPYNICPGKCLLLSFYNYNSTKQLLMCGLDPHLVFQQGNNHYGTVFSYLGHVLTHVKIEEFFCVLELLQFTVMKPPARQFFYNVFKLYHQLKPHLSASKEYKERWKAILQQVDQPSSLQNICRVEIRQVMISLHGYSSFRQVINDLNVPDILKKYLLYSEMNTVGEHPFPHPFRDC